MDPKKKRKINPMLLNVLIISGLVHVALIVILGGITIVNYVIPSEVQFEEPPEVEQEEPPREVKVEIRQNAPAQQDSMQNLRMRDVGNITVASVNVDLPSMDDAFTVSTAIGGFGGGNLLGNARGSIGLGVSDINVFGLTARAEKVLFVISAHRSMVYDAKGGLPSYQTIKDEIVTMVGGLSAGTLFNVVLRDGHLIRTFKPQLVPAGRDIADELRTWIQPVNSSLETLGLGPGGRVPEIGRTVTRFPELTEVLQHGRNNGSHARLLQYMLETGVDAIFEITGHHTGFGGFAVNNLSERERERAREAHDRAVSDPKIQEQLEAHRKERAEVQRKINEAHTKLNETRRARGLPPRVLEGDFYHQARFFGFEFQNPHPQIPQRDPGWAQLEPRLVNRYFRELVNEFYRDRGAEAPTVNVVLFLAGDEDLPKAREDAINEYVRFFRGRMRVLRGLDEIRDSAGAASVRNR